jgi:hypothetical protein
MITVYIPANDSFNYHEREHLHNGQLVTTKYIASVHNGRRVIPVTVDQFIKLIGGPNGLAWHNENVEALEWIAANKTNPHVDAFPGASRAPLADTAGVESAPVMVKMLAPEGASSFSHEGVELKIGKDGSITVEAGVAAVMQSHGFRAAA